LVELAQCPDGFGAGELVSPLAGGDEVWWCCQPAPATSGSPAVDVVLEGADDPIKVAEDLLIHLD
jgi:hypothetical protein